MTSNKKNNLVKKLLWLFVSIGFVVFTFSCKQQGSPERTILFIIDGMPPGLHERIDMPNFDALVREGVLYKEVYLPLPAHPDSSDEYPWTCSIPNPVLMAGTVFIGQEGIKNNLIQHSFKKRPTAFLVNAWSYSAIGHDFTFYKDFSDGRIEYLFRDEIPVQAGQEIILKHDPEFIRIHCQGPGRAGYRSYSEPEQSYSGNIWSSGSPFIKQNQYVDSLLGNFIRWLKDEDLWKSTVLIVMGDHGQADSGWHPPYEHESYVTQMVIAGAGIKQGVNYDYAEIIDVAPTIAWLQNVNIPKFSDGRILKEIKKGNSSSGETFQLLKKLNKAQVEFNTLYFDYSDSLFFNIKQIGVWHTGKFKNNYREFVNQQVNHLNNLKEEM